MRCFGERERMVIFSTIGGTTRKVAQRVAGRIGDDVLLDAGEALSSPVLRGVAHVLLFSPTYGDEELEESFERLLLHYDWESLKGAGFAFCELGIYTGYENFGHGLDQMVCRTLVDHGLHQLAPSLSIDAVPITDWMMVDAWSDLILSHPVIRS
jgi:Flavodoxins